MHELRLSASSHDSLHIDSVYTCFISVHPCSLLFFFFNDTATTEIYTLSLHDALPISPLPARARRRSQQRHAPSTAECRWREKDRKSTRLNSSHRCISYAVFCLKKKKKKK